MTVSILGLGTAQPATICDQEQAIAHASALFARTPRQSRWLASIYRSTRIHRRAAVAYQANGNGHTGEDVDALFPVPPADQDERVNDREPANPGTARRMRRYADEAVPLALAACGPAMREAGVGPDRITHLVTCSCTGFFAPGLDIQLVKQLGLRPSVSRTHVGFMGCHGAFNALSVGRAIAEGDPRARVLVCAVELCSVHLNYAGGREATLANALFADGAGAAVLANEDRPGWRLRDQASMLFADTETLMGWRIEDHGFTMTLSPEVARSIGPELEPWLNGWLGGRGLSVHAISRWAVHPGGPQLLRTISDRLALPPDALHASWHVLRECGNMSSATVLFVLQHLAGTSTAGPCLALGFGPGLVGEALLLD